MRFPLFALAALASFPALAFQSWHPPALYVEGEVLVKYRTPGVAAKAVSALGLTTVKRLEWLGVERVRLPAYLDVANAVALLNSDPTVEYAEPNFLRRPLAVMPNDPLFGDQWGLRNTGQPNFVQGGPAGVAGGDLNMIQAWDANGDGVADRTGNPSVTVAVIDDSVAIHHPDLTANIVPGHDYVCDDNDPSPDSDDEYHGTLVSGCVAGTGNNAVGVAGVAWHTSLMPLKFAFDEATHLEAIEFARSHGADIINASFGGPGFSQTELDAIKALQDDGILYVTAAGNEDSNMDLAQLNYPANYDAENVVAVAATNRQDNIASFSVYGPLTVDVAAPGLQIVTTESASNGYTTNPGVGGTSFASPYTAGVAALIRAHVVPTPDWPEIKARLVESGSAAAGANPKELTAGGRVDADQALDMTPRPSLVLRSVTFKNGDGNGVLDPGETLNVEIGIRNLWQAATGVTATLDAGRSITVNTASVSLGAIAANGTATATFNITVSSGVDDHQVAPFTVTLAADGGHSATRGYLAEIGKLVPGTPVTQHFADAFEEDRYGEFHAWHVDVPAAGAGHRTLVLRTGLPAGEDIDLIAKAGTPPRYSITLGDSDSGYFCTSGTTSSCQDPDTLVSGRQDGNEAITVVDPPAGPFHLVVVNFDQQAHEYSLSAAIANGDLRPDPFDLGAVAGAATNSTQVSDTITVSGIDTPTFITVNGGEYSINGGGYTASEGTVSNGAQVRVRGIADADKAVQLTIGGVTDSFLINPATGGGGEPTQCPAGGGTGGDGGGGVGIGVPGSGKGGALGWEILLLLPAALRRRRRR